MNTVFFGREEANRTFAIVRGIDATLQQATQNQLDTNELRLAIAQLDANIQVVIQDVS